MAACCTPQRRPSHPTTPFVWMSVALHFALAAASLRAVPRVTLSAQPTAPVEIAVLSGEAGSSRIPLNRVPSIPRLPQHAPSTSQSGLKPESAGVGGAGTDDAAAPTSSANAFAEYLASINRLLRRDSHYPVESQERDERGTVIVAIELDPTGVLMGATVVQSSSFESLDRAALHSVRSVGVFPLPPSFVGPRIRLHLPFHYGARSY